MEVQYKKDIDSTYLILEETVPYQEDYQMQMLRSNQIPGLLEISGSGLDDVSRYYYNICGKVSMKGMYEKAKISRKDLLAFLRQFIKALKSTQAYMLSADCLLLEPEYIFYEQEEFYFCYYPPGKADIGSALHKLSEYLVSQIDYADKEGMYVAYELHKRTMDENYNIEQIMNSLMEQKTEAAEAIGRIKAKVDTIKADDQKMQPDPGIQKQKKQLKKSLKKRLLARKKPKWGEWDDLQIEEEEL